ncbi:GlsB/YeaQ/YmgE family stress response membrane protein [Bifidobacterium cuniculi]|uniref:Transglycosylase associated protein n=2 Tax=Bifidobacterium cuniculi TaxID=1688 RepID=A0A087ATE7_9BIFI|nr:GlsB/YeaQ/YmgE family stress response membrane protein [Bifidobacterium cuniculi]KFI62047.1 transglycosylase associated protein [Bifidobacterium cuniculi]
MFWIWTLIAGAIIGVVAGAITHNEGSMGWIANIVAGLTGSALGQALFGAWGPSLGGMAVIPSILGAIIVVAIVSLVLTHMRSTNRTRTRG